MALRPVEPGFQLPPDSVAALQAVDLRLGFLVHGARLSNSTVIHGVVDEDYQGAAALSDQLVPGRDIFAQENYQKPPLLDPYLVDWKRSGEPLPTQGEYAATLALEDADKLASRLPGMTIDDCDVLALASRNMPDPAGPMGQQLAATWDKLAAQHAIDPVNYAAGRAAMRGIKLWTADATMEQMVDFRRKWFRLLLDPYPTSRLEQRYTKGPELKFRNNRALEVLGRAALTQDTNGPERPILVYGVGIEHGKDLSKKLTRHGIPFTSELISPDWRSRKKRYIRGEL